EKPGLPFVFAFWAVRLDSLDRTPENVDLVNVFQQSRDRGLLPENLDVIQKEWSTKLGLTEAHARRYLTETIHSYLDRPNHSGLKLFLQYAQEIGLIPSVPELRFL